MPQTEYSDVDPAAGRASAIHSERVNPEARYDSQDNSIHENSPSGRHGLAPASACDGAYSTTIWSNECHASRPNRWHSANAASCVAPRALGSHGSSGESLYLDRAMKVFGRLLTAHFLYRPMCLKALRHPIVMLQDLPQNGCTRSLQSHTIGCSEILYPRARGVRRERGRNNILAHSCFPAPSPAVRFAWASAKHIPAGSAG